MQLKGINYKHFQKHCKWIILSQIFHEVFEQKMALLPSQAMSDNENGSIVKYLQFY